jgi:hypothetical protein
MTISASTAAILDFPLPVWSYSIPSVSIGFLDLENGGVAVDILFLCSIEAEIRWGYFYPLLAIYVCKKRLATAGLNSRM